PFPTRSLSATLPLLPPTNTPPTTYIYTLSLHDALPICNTTEGGTPHQGRCAPPTTTFKEARTWSPVWNEAPPTAGRTRYDVYAAEPLCAARPRRRPRP